MALIDKLTAIANAIRGKTGKEDSLTLEQMVTEIEGIEAGGGKPVFESFLTDRIANNIVSVNEIVPGGRLEDTTPPPEPGTYYNGVKLPEIPADVLAEYPYAWIRKDDANGNYNLVFGKQPWYYDAEPVLICGDKSSLPYYSIAISSYLTATEWTNLKDGGGTNFGLAANRTVLWSNHDIPNGSATATEIYFKGSNPVIVE